MGRGSSYDTELHIYSFFKKKYNNASSYNSYIWQSQILRVSYFLEDTCTHYRRYLYKFLSCIFHSIALKKNHRAVFFWKQIWTKAFYPFRKKHWAGKALKESFSPFISKTIFRINMAQCLLRTTAIWSIGTWNWLDLHIFFP